MVALVRRRVAGWQVAVALVLALAALCPVALPTAVASAREIDVVGTVDCGRPSGQRCSVDDSVALLTDGPSGRTRLTVNIAWVKRSLPTLDQDDTLCLLVEDLPGGDLRAVGLVEPCGHGGTTNPGASTGTRKAREQPKPRQEDDDDNTARQVAVVGTGILTGTVVSAASGQPIAGARVTGPGGSTVTTDAAGRFTLSGVPLGAQQLQISAANFASATRAVTVVEGTNPPLAIGLTPLPPAAQDEIILSWTQTASDLDIHLSGPAPAGRFHLYFANRTPVPYVTLVSDRRVGPGSEQVIIRRDPGTNQFVPGEYRVWIHNFSGTPEFNATGAAVTIQRDGVQVGQLDVAGATGDPNQDLWHVVNLTIDADGNVTLAPVQEFKPGDESTIL